jgi:2-polyprenyl-3-methyl-5-hydroxy-6-metoxy-1,4-benzoquinol methylase
MIRVLSDWNEVGGAVVYCQDGQLPLHATPQKNWDHMQIAEMLRAKSTDVRIVDLGSGDGHGVWFLYKLGFTNLRGVDLRVPLGAVARQWWGCLRSAKKRLPFRISRRDICSTGLPSAAYDFLTCISVIEHGVKLDAFAKECARLLKPGGLAYVSTDYWSEPGDPTRQNAARSAGTIFDRQGIAAFLSCCEAHGLTPLSGGDIPECKERVVHHLGSSYTFLSVILRRTA